MSTLVIAETYESGKIFATYTLECDCVVWPSLVKELVGYPEDMPDSDTITRSLLTQLDTHQFTVRQLSAAMKGLYHDEALPDVVVNKADYKGRQKHNSFTPYVLPFFYDEVWVEEGPQRWVQVRSKEDTE